MFALEKSIPNETGINMSSVEGFIKRLNNAQIPMHSILLMHKGKLITEAYYKPYNRDSLHRMFSITKSFVSIAIGLLVDEGAVSLDDKIIKYFPDMLPEKIHPWLEALTIRDMLMMRTCYANTTYVINKTINWTESYFTAVPQLPPGKLFHYDTSSAQTMCALAERITGMPMLDYIKEKLSPLDFSKESFVLKDPVGTSIGGSGLMATSRDILKFGYFLINKGKVDGKQLISPEYIELATSCLSDTRMQMPVKTEHNGYGMQFWRYDNDGYMCYGMGGQFVIVLPKEDLVLVTTADTQGIAGGNQVIHTAFLEEIVAKISSDSCDYTEEDAKNYNDFLSGLSLYPLSSMDISDSALPAGVAGKVYKVINEQSPFDNFSFSFKDDEGIVSYTLNGMPISHPFGIGRHVESDFPKYNMHCASSGSIIDDKTLYIRIECLDAYLGMVHMIFAFDGNNLTIEMKKIEESIFLEYNCLLYAEA